MVDPIDLSQSLADRAHEGIRLAVQQALADGADGFMLTDVLFDMLDAAFAALDELTARVEALEG